MRGPTCQPPIAIAKVPGLRHPPNPGPRQRSLNTDEPDLTPGCSAMRETDDLYEVLQVSPAAEPQVKLHIGGSLLATIQT